MKMNNIFILHREKINYAIRIIMGFVFIYASFDKITDPNSFSQNIHNYGVTPIYLENIIALILPWIELIIGLGLILNIKYEASLNISIALMIAFILLISQAYLRGKSIDCGCFLNDTSAISLEDAHEKRIDMLKRIFEDIIFLLLLIALKYQSRTNKVNTW